MFASVSPEPRTQEVLLRCLVSKTDVCYVVLEFIEIGDEGQANSQPSSKKQLEYKFHLKHSTKDSKALSSPEMQPLRRGGGGIQLADKTGFFASSLLKPPEPVFLMGVSIFFFFFG